MPGPPQLAFDAKPSRAPLLVAVFLGVVAIVGASLVYWSGSVTASRDKAIVLEATKGLESYNQRVEAFLGRLTTGNPADHLPLIEGLINESLSEISRAEILEALWARHDGIVFELRIVHSDIKQGHSVDESPVMAAVELARKEAQELRCRARLECP